MIWRFLAMLAKERRQVIIMPQELGSTQARPLLQRFCRSLGSVAEIVYITRRRPGGHATLVPTERAQAALFSGRA
jgi:hypothetical protein